MDLKGGLAPVVIVPLLGYFPLPISQLHLQVCGALLDLGQDLVCHVCEHDLSALGFLFDTALFGTMHTVRLILPKLNL